LADSRELPAMGRCGSGAPTRAAMTGDSKWRPHLRRLYRKLLDGKCANLNNVSGGKHGGAIVAALYLPEFVWNAITWIHLDIAGSNARARPGRPEGAETMGMRALYAFICERYGYRAGHPADVSHGGNITHRGRRSWN
jgi:leucyl aminopeptidase